MSEDVKEDALIAILNIAQQAVYANELLRTLDGKLLAMAAEDMGHSRRLRYIYASVLCNLLFDTYMQQLIYGDQIARVLVNGFIFFENDTWSHCRRKSDSGEPVSAVSSSTPTTEKDYMQELNLAFDDDKERFLASIYLIASELVDLGNTELIVSLVLPCMQAFRNLVATLPSSGTPSHAQRLQMQQHLPIACYASASLFALTRAATQRRDSHKHFICSEEVETTLIAICGLPSGPGFSVGAGSSGGISSSSRGGVTQAFCAATLYHLCASTSVNQRAIQGLIDCCNANEETQSLLACSAAFAIISFTSEGCWQLVQCENLARALNRLGRTSQVECQQYAAIAACNVSTVRCIWSSPELKDFIVVALLRANSIQAKQIHAKTLSNLLSHGKTRPNVVEDGVLYALMKLSQVMMSGTAAPPTNSIRVERRASLSMDNPAISSSPLSSSTMPSSADEVFSIGLRALFNLSCDHKYHHKLLSNGIMAYLSAAVESKNAASSPNVKDLGKNASNPDSSSVAYLFGAKRSTQKQQPHQSPQSQCCASHLSMESRRFVLAIICNLASYEENHKELMRAQVTEIIRNYADDDIESRASATMALRNLSCRQPWVEMLCERKTLQLLITSTENDHPMVRQFAVEALANCSLVTDSIHMFGDLRVPRAVLALLEITVNIKPSASTPPISVSLELPSEQVDNGVHSSAQALESRETSGKSTCMAALRCLYNIAHDDALALALMEERIVLRMLVLLEYRALGADVSACELAVSIVHTLAGKPRCAEELLGQRSVSVCALLHRRHAESSVIARECVWILMLLSTYQHIQLQLCETQAVAVLVSICNGSALASTNNLEIASRSLRLRECGAVAIRNLTLCVTEHLSLFYERHDDGDGSLRDVGSNSGTILLRLDEPKIVPNNDDGDDPDAEDASVSLLLERHMLQGIKYFQEEVVSGQASDRILLEASAAIANLSTIKVFRVEMVRLGVIPTLLQLMTQPQAKSQRKSLSSPTLSSKSPARLRNTCRGSLLGRICAATLHRLVVEDDAEVDARSQLVPSLLWVLHQTDDELQQVRYECEKISIFTPTNTFGEQGDEAMTSDTSMMGRQFTDIQSRTSTVQEASEVLPQESADSSISTGVGPTNYRQRKHGSVNAILPLPAGAGSAHCVRQSYREQKWMVYVLKTILSSQSMIPQLEKKQLRTLGLPKLCFQDLPPSSFFESPPAPSGSISSRSTASTQCADPDSNSEAPTAGYLLPVNMEKHVIRNLNGVEEIVPVSMAEAASPTRVSSAATVRPIVSGVSGASSGLQPRCHSASPSRTQPEKDPSTIDLGQHGLKFNRQMRLLRRNDRRDLNSLPPV
ncbi:hypothetical protein PHYBOEH_002979 [Phytophthora boehmeriae]|uniref:Armadillo-type fold n=1 Tax=Phytophthora boehmeriae TaxID=109152 RepID=A0A8T1X5R5_9STRA|nr:hypothetical protein PHYBOEH_002979 [Phytophthora boehmeriae]